MEDVDDSAPLTTAQRGIQKLQMRRKFKVGVDAARHKKAQAQANANAKAKAKAKAKAAAATAR